MCLSTRNLSLKISQNGQMVLEIFKFEFREIYITILNFQLSSPSEKIVVVGSPSKSYHTSRH